MQLCLDCLDGSFLGELADCGSVPEDGPVIGLILVLEGPEMRGSCCSDGPGMGYLDVRMVLERVCCVCVSGEDMVSVVVICSALCFYHVDARCGGWSCNCTFNI